MNRHRETVTGSFSDVNHLIQASRPSPFTGSFSVISDQITYTGTQRVKSIDDVVLPGFYHLIKCGKFLPINPVVISTTTTQRNAGAWDVHGDTKYGSEWRYSFYATGPRWLWITPLLTLAPVDPSITQYVTNKAVANCRQSLWDVLTFIGELRETMAMVRSAFLRVDSFALRAAGKARRKGRSQAEIYKLFQNYWLEYRYGWRPLCADVANALTSFSTKRHRHEIVRGRGSQTQDLSDSKVTVTTTNLGHSITRTQTCTESFTGTRTYRGVAFGEVGDPSLARWGSDPFVTAWELIPYSFVMDWFIDVGSYLQAISPFQAGKLVGAGASIKDEYTYTQSVDAQDTGGDSTYRQYGGMAGMSTTITVDTYQRFTTTPGLPSWNPRLSDVKLIDLVALVMQRVRVVEHLLRKR